MVDLHPDQDDIHHKVQPEHQKHQGGQASVHIEGMAVLNIDGKSVGKQIPACRCEKRPWKLLYKARPSVGKDHVKQGKKQRKKR